MDNYLFNKIKEIAESYDIHSNDWCRKTLKKWEYYDSWSDNFRFEDFVKEACRIERGFMNHYEMDHDEVRRRIEAMHKMRKNKS